MTTARERQDALEGLEQGRDGLLADPDARVLDDPAHRHALVVLGDALGTQRDRTFRAELDGVAEEVVEDLAQARHVADDERAKVVDVVVDEAKALLPRGRREETRIGRQVVEVERTVLEIELASLDLAHVLSSEFEVSAVTAGRG